MDRARVGLWAGREWDVTEGRFDVPEHLVRLTGAKETGSESCACSCFETLTCTLDHGCDNHIRDNCMCDRLLTFRKTVALTCSRHAL